MKYVSREDGGDGVPYYPILQNTAPFDPKTNPNPTSINVDTGQQVNVPLNTDQQAQLDRKKADDAAYAAQQERNRLEAEAAAKQQATVDANKQINDALAAKANNLLNPAQPAAVTTPPAQDTSFNANLAKGQDYASTIFKPGLLGRVDATSAPMNTAFNNMQQGTQNGAYTVQNLPTLDPNSSQDLQAVLAARKQQQNGYTPAELQAMREQQQHQVDIQSQGVLSKLQSQLGAAGIQGGANLSRQAGVLMNAANQNSDIERNLILDQATRKQQALDSLEKTAGTLNADQLDRAKFGINQASDVGKFNASSNLSAANQLAQYAGQLSNSDMARQTYNNQNTANETLGGSALALNYADYLAADQQQKESDLYNRLGLARELANNTTNTAGTANPSQDAFQRLLAQL